MTPEGRLLYSNIITNVESVEFENKGNDNDAMVFQETTHFYLIIIVSKIVCGGTHV